MTLETKKTRNVEITRLSDAASERELERRLAADLDAFLATVDDDAFFFADEDEEAKAKERKAQRAANATKRDCNRRRFRALASTCAAAALLGVVAWTAFDGVASQKETTRAKTSEIASVAPSGDETSLVAWSVEKWSETDRASLWRQIEERWVNVDALSDWDDASDDADVEENFWAFDGDADAATNGAERNEQENENAGIDVIAWDNALSDEEISLTLWTYDPLLRIAALLR